MQEENVPILEAVDLCKRFGRQMEIAVLNDVSLAIASGEFVSITGPSGSGKSTLLYLLGALDKPTSGSLYLDGTDLSTLSERQLTAIRQHKIGFVFQFHYLLPEFTALENVAVPRLLAHQPTYEVMAEAAALLEKVGLTHRQSHRPSQLSGGEQQRVAIARALINHPRLLLADEPTGNLDTENSRRVFSMLRFLNHSEGTAMITVTHNRDLAQQADRLIHLVDGRITSNL